MSLLHLWRAWSIKLLKEKARIIVESAAFVLGVTDETKTLRGYWKTKTWPRRSPNLDALPEIFLQISDRNKKGVYKVVEGICVLGRNPSLHPGDLRVVRAVDNLALRHLKDVVVFPQTGERDIPSMCSGGDLDGDDYFVIWDTALIPKEWNPEPMNYTAAKPVEINRPVTINDVMEFFVRYMKNDSLGAIAHAHLANSDFLDNGVKNPRCLELAVLHSKAVDYIKSGEPADLPKHLRPRKWPHFMEKHHKPKEQIYHSEKVLGQLYDRVESIRFVAQYGEPFDQRILTCRNPSKELKEIARRQKVQYDTAMRRIMAQQGIETEFEIWSTFALSKPRVGSDYKMQEELGTIAGALKDRFRKDCKTLANATSPGDVEVLAVAMYLVTWEEMEVALRECKMTKLVDGKEVPVRKLEPRYMPLISFPWLFYEVIGRLASGTARRDEVQELEKLGFQMASAPKSVRVHSHEATGDESPDIEQLETEEGVVIKEGQQLDLGDLRRHSPSQDSSLPPDQNVVERGVEEPANPLNVPHSPGPAAPRLEGGLFPADLNSTTVEGLPAVVTPLHMDAGGPRQLVGLGLQGVNSADGLLDSEVASEPHTNAQMLTVDSKQEKTGGNARIDVEEVIIQHAEESALEKLLKLTELSDDE
jgi:RNA-dependent RNA polymerase